MCQHRAVAEDGPMCGDARDPEAGPELVDADAGYARTFTELA